jgi:Neurotransmitter-gated ion-channel ligand binding domain
MKQRLFDVPGQAALCLLLLAFVAHPVSQAANILAKKPGVDLRKHPTGGKTPIDISVGLYLTNVVAIDESRESFEVAGFLTGKWQDPRLALTGDPTSDKSEEPETTRNFLMEDLWTPSIQGANTISFKTFQYSLEADRSGMVTYWERFDGVFSSDFQLAKFPFDTQVLRFEFQPFLSSASHIRFAAQALPSTGISSHQHTELAAWHLQELRYTAEKVTNDRFLPPIQEALFEIVVKRRSAFYVWKIFLPLLIMTMIPVVVFWIDVKEFDWILKIPMTMLLSMVAFEFTVTRDLPRVGYLTFLDAVFLASFAFCFLGIFEITAVYLLQKHGRRPLAARLHCAGKWAYPLAYSGVVSILAVGFLA